MAGLYLEEFTVGQTFVHPFAVRCTLGLVIGLSIHDTTLGTTVANLGMSETIFPKPVFVGDTLRVETVVISPRPTKSRPNREPGAQH
jgi:acyl dehydratase